MLDLIAAAQTLTEGHGRAILTEQGPRAAQGAGPCRPRRRLVGPRDRGVAPAERASRAPEPRSGPVSIHPDLVDALAAAEDALTAALGHEVKVRARGDGVRAELSFDSPRRGDRPGREGAARRRAPACPKPLEGRPDRSTAARPAGHALRSGLVAPASGD
ncbi:MAG: hypothetical protein WKF40_11340 [Thermoleophilaceae bacterium]